MSREQILQQVKDALNQLTPREKCDRSLLADVTKIIEGLQKEVIDDIRAEDERQRKAARKKQRKLARKATEWAEEHLEPGMYIKVVGTRDGHGARRVLEVNRDKKSVTCRQVTLIVQDDQMIVEDLPYITEHMFKKVRGEIVPELIDTGIDSRRRYKAKWVFKDSV